MDKLFTQSAYAEDQTNAHAILTIHVLRAGVGVGSIISLASASLTTLLRKPRTLSQFTRRLIVHGARGVVGGLVFSTGALVLSMWGKEQIEWQDRAWRLLASKSQTEADRWMVAGSVVCAAAMGMVVAGARRGALGGLKLDGGVGVEALGRGRVAVSGVGLGAALGLVGCVGWRRGVHGGRF